jgi:hypothetical protein
MDEYSAFEKRNKVIRVVAIVTVIAVAGSGIAAAFFGAF